MLNNSLHNYFIVVLIYQNCFYLQALEAEIVAHEPLIDDVSSSAQRMIQAEHFAGLEIKSCLEKLLKDLQELKEQTFTRKKVLQESLESQKVIKNRIKICR